MNKINLLECYGHIEMQYMQENGLYYFESLNGYSCGPIIIATEFVPELATPSGSLPLALCESGNIVGVIIDNKLTVFDYTYELPLKEMEESIC